MLYYLTKSFEEWLSSAGWLSVIKVFTQFHFRAFAALLFSFFFVILLGPRTIDRLRRLKVGDQPEFYNAQLNEINGKKKDTPTMGGILIVGAICVSTMLFADIVYSQYVKLSLLVLVWLAVVGSFDDWLKLTAARRAAGTREGLFAWEKLLFQLGCGLLVSFFLYQAANGSENPAAISLNLPFQKTYLSEKLSAIKQTGPDLNPSVILLGVWIFVAFGGLMIAGTSNAVNIADGMDGLAAGTMSICSIVVMVLCYLASSSEFAGLLLVPWVPGATELIIVSGAMAGACLGFLWFNCNPARVFMGDTGSLALGGLLSFIAVAIRQEFLLFLIAGIFYMELASTALQVGYFKWSGGKRIFRCAPIHHHFQLGGWSESQVVVRFWIITAVLGALALVSVKLR